MSIPSARVLKYAELQLNWLNHCNICMYMISYHIINNLPFALLCTMSTFVILYYIYMLLGVKCIICQQNELRSEEFKNFKVIWLNIIF